jgi:hypothetical protein
MWKRVFYEISGAVFKQVITGYLPVNTQLMSQRLYLNFGATAAPVAYDCSVVYVETRSWAGHTSEPNLVSRFPGRILWELTVPPLEVARMDVQFLHRLEQLLLAGDRGNLSFCAEGRATVPA